MAINLVFSRLANISLFVLALSLASCGTEEAAKDEAENTEELLALGRKLYSEKHLDGNSFTCQTCHGLSDASDADGQKYIKVGHPIGDAYNRTSFKNGAITSLLEAVNTCRVEWMAATNYTSMDADWLALNRYLEQEAEGREGSVVSFEIASLPDDLSGGSIDDGKVHFKKTCGLCHGEEARGSKLGPSIAKSSLTDATIAKKVRTSGLSDSQVYDGLTGGRMPFWSSNRLTDNHLRDILAFLKTTTGEEVVTQEDSGSENPVDISLSGGVRSSCGKTHAKIGQSFTFPDATYHKVAGTVTIVDDCTLKIDNFSFDGGGIVVQIYSGVDGNYINGTALSKDIYGTSFSEQEVVFSLPEGFDLDQMNGISVWCVDVKVSFGDGILQ